jgi:ATP-dependent DNA helicase RecG
VTPYAPTAAQQRAFGEVSRALAQPRVMRRLLTGDVGSGKTLVAANAIAQCLAANRRAAFLAPTAILAEQQAAALQRLLPQHRVALLHAGTPRKEREALLRDLQSRASLAIVGTHALLYDSVRIDNLGLLVVDEQQRFGVRQRSALAEGDTPPHQLSLSATPIPRTLALALRGLLEVSHLDEKPPGRAPIATHIVTRDKALAAVKKESGLVYWICPTIKDDDDTRGVLTVADWLENKYTAPIHVCHGQQAVSERAEQLAQFREQGGVLVATTVVEVGLDIPEATLMVIESPERLGLAQLHQLRGRVGRGDEPGRCLLVSDRKTKRLDVLTREHDGLRIAEADLQIRGMGELAGEEQSGFPSLPPLPKEKLEALVHQAEACAASIEAHDPELREPGHLRLARALTKRNSD